MSFAITEHTVHIRDQRNILLKIHPKRCISFDRRNAKRNKNSSFPRTAIVYEFPWLLAPIAELKTTPAIG
jgi:hypothetical protein